MKPLNVLQYYRSLANGIAITATWHSVNASFLHLRPLIQSSTSTWHAIPIITLPIITIVTHQITNGRTDELAHHKLPFAHNPPAPSPSKHDYNRYINITSLHSSAMPYFSSRTICTASSLTEKPYLMLTISLASFVPIGLYTIGDT